MEKGHIPPQSNAEVLSRRISVKPTKLLVEESTSCCEGPKAKLQLSGQLTTLWQQRLCLFCPFPLTLFAYELEPGNPRNYY
jgi:hypothetical protein